jgi:hypothetical protein
VGRELSAVDTHIQLRLCGFDIEIGAMQSLCIMSSLPLVVVFQLLRSSRIVKRVLLTRYNGLKTNDTYAFHGGTLAEGSGFDEQE